MIRYLGGRWLGEVWWTVGGMMPSVGWFGSLISTSTVRHLSDGSSGSLSGIRRARLEEKP